MSAVAPIRLILLVLLGLWSWQASAQGEPVAAEPAEPDTVEPAEPDTVEPAEPDTVEPAEPDTAEPAEPDTAEPVGTTSAPPPPSDDVADAPDDDGDKQDPGEDAEEPTMEERLDAILAEVLPEDEYRETTNCLYRGHYRHIRIVSPDYLLFEKNNQFWLNKLRRTCVGLKRRMVITTVTHGVQSMCANDLVYANHSSDLNHGFTPSGRPLMARAICTLGQFEQINEQQAQALLDPGA